MPAADARRWDARHLANLDQPPGSPRAFLRDHAHYLPRRGWALDVAMGRGAAAGFLLEHGLNVIGVDISAVAVRAAHDTWPGLNAVRADLTNFEVRAGSLDVIVNFYYLERSLWPAFRRMLKPGGVLIFETLTEAMSAVHPGVDSAHLLAPRELLSAFGDWDVLDYREGWTEPVGRSRRATAAIAARRRA